MEGNLNYIITKLLRAVYGKPAHSYRDVNDALGVLFGAALEHYATVARPYEDQKRFENGDVETHIEPIQMETINIISDQQGIQIITDDHDQQIGQTVAEMQGLGSHPGGYK